MSGPHPPGQGSFGEEPGRQPKHAQPTPEPELTDTGFSRAYSAPESEQFTSGPYIPVESSLYDYDMYGARLEEEDPVPPRWPWVVGVTAILAAIALVVSVSLLVTRTDSANLANPGTTSTTIPTTLPPVQDEITTTEAPPPPPPPPPTTHTETVTVTPEPPPPPPPETTTVEAPPPPPPPPPATTTQAPPPATTTTTTPTTTAPAAPRQITYSITGTKAPGDVISITYVDASGRSRTQRNVYIPWSLTVTPISQSEVGSVEASSLFLVSRLNCSITSSDGTVLSANSSNGARTRC